MLRAVVALATLLVLTGASAASTSAKDWYLLQVCGASRCVTYHNNSAVKVLSSWSNPFGPKSAPAPAPYFSIRSSSPVAPSMGVTKMLYVPTRHEVRIWQSRTAYGPQPVSAYWRTVPSDAETTLDRALAHIAPHSTPRAWPPAG
jgi:hypothetical protein